jgi:hypothetical protein
MGTKEIVRIRDHLSGRSVLAVDRAIGRTAVARRPTEQ